MNTTIGMIVLNEAQFIEANLKQHYELVDNIVIVEGADRLYPKTNVTEDGLSTDDTAEIIRNFPDIDHKIKFIQHGWTHIGGEQAKCELRNRYMEDILSGLLIAVDADEFYRFSDLKEAKHNAAKQSQHHAWLYPQIHFWRNTKTFITGGYYDVPHIRFWRVRDGDRYTVNHNHPYRNGKSVHRLDCVDIRRNIIQASRDSHYVPGPVCYHMGFCKPHTSMTDKSEYYLNRGEGASRIETTASRAAWFGDDTNLPKELRLLKYGGPLPEVFQAHDILVR